MPPLDPPDDPEVPLPLLPLVPDPEVPPPVPPEELLGVVGTTDEPLLELEPGLTLELELEELDVELDALISEPHSLNPYAEAAVDASDLALSSSVSNWVGSSPR